MGDILLLHYEENSTPPGAFPICLVHVLLEYVISDALRAKTFLECPKSSRARLAVHDMYLAHAHKSVE